MMRIERLCLATDCFFVFAGLDQVLSELKGNLWWSVIRKARRLGERKMSSALLMLTLLDAFPSVAIFPT